MPNPSQRDRTVAAIAAAAERWCNADFPSRVRALSRIVERTRYSVPVVEFALDALFGSLTEEALRATIDAELGTASTAAVGRVAILSSRTTIGVAIVPAVFALCAGCDVIVKDREDALVTAFFETLAEELGDTEPAFAAAQWDGEREPFDFDAYDAVVAFGAYDTLHAIAARVRADARFIGYGPKASIGYVTVDELCDESAASAIAAGAARDFMLYDGEGCLSLHALFVELGGAVTPQRFMALLAEAVEPTSAEFPLGHRDNMAWLRVMSLRDVALFHGPCYSDDEASFLIETGSPDRPPAFAPRVLAIHAVDTPARMSEYVDRYRLPIEICAVAAARDDVVDAALRAGACGIARFGEMQMPPLSHRHGGRPRIAEFVRFSSEDS